MSLPANLSTPEAIKAELNIPLTDTGIDSFISIAQGWADSRIVELCNQQILTTTQTLQFFGDLGRIRMVLPNFPVVSITSLKSSQNTLPFSFTNVSYPFALFPTDDKGNADIYFPSGFYGGMVYQLAYIYGSATVPATVANVAVEMVTMAVRESSVTSAGKSRLGVSSDSWTEQITRSTTYKDSLPKWRSMLKPFTKFTSA